MRWSKELGDYDYDYYEQATFVLVKESHKAIRIKLIDRFRGEYDGLVFWMPKSVTKDYNDRDPNIKTAWFWEKLFSQYHFFLRSLSITSSPARSSIYF